jgi:hypothetical protein
MPLAERPWVLDVQGSSPAREEFCDWDEATALIQAVQQAEICSDRSTTWLDVCTDLDLRETAERSLRRKRTIEVRQDDRSEESAFKGVMSAVGCSLLMLALVILLSAAVIEGFRMPFADPPVATGTAAESLPLWIRLWPVYPLLAFLSMQLLLIVARRPGGKRGVVGER